MSIAAEITGIQGVGVMPPGWRVSKLKHLATFRSGENITVASIEDEGQYPVFGGNGLRGYTTGYTHDGDFVLIGRQGALCGNINYARGRFWASEHAVVVTPRNNIRLRWLGELLRAMELGRFSVTAAQPGLSVEFVVNLTVPVPPGETQEAIIAFLDRKTSRVDDLIFKKQQQIDLLEDKRRALISEATTQGIRPDTKMVEAKVPWLRRVPAHWVVERLRHRIHRIGQGWSPQCETRQAEPGEWGILKVGCMNSGTYDESENKALPPDLDPDLEYEVKPGDVLMSRSNTAELVGAVGIVHQTQGKILVCDKLYRIEFVRSKLLPEYAVFLLRSRAARQQIEREATGASSSMKNISNEVVANLVLGFPPIGEQQEILSHLKREMKTIDSLESAIQRQIIHLREYRQAVITAAVMGQTEPVFGEVA